MNESYHAISTWFQLWVAEKERKKGSRPKSSAVVMYSLPIYLLGFL
jgi:hypothetical protein